MAVVQQHLDRAAHGEPDDDDRPDAELGQEGGGVVGAGFE